MYVFYTVTLIHMHKYRGFNPNITATSVQHLCITSRSEWSSVRRSEPQLTPLVKRWRQWLSRPESPGSPPTGCPSAPGRSHWQRFGWTVEKHAAVSEASTCTSPITAACLLLLACHSSPQCWVASDEQYTKLCCKLWWWCCARVSENLRLWERSWWRGCSHTAGFHRLLQRQPWATMSRDCPVR